MTDQGIKSLAGQVRSQIQSLKNQEMPRNSMHTQHSDNSLQVSVQMPQSQVCVAAEQYSIAQLERKMMFLNEPLIQTYVGKSITSSSQGDLVKHLWRIHNKQMSFTAQTNAAKRQQRKTQMNEDEVDQSVIHSQNIITGFSSSLPREFDKFQKQVNQQIKGITDVYQNLKRRFSNTNTELEQEVSKIDRLTETLQSVFDDFVTAYNSFVTREEKLATLHQQAVQKSQELTKKINLELMSASSQRAQLLSIIDDLNIKLKKAKMQVQQIDTEQLKTIQQQYADIMLRFEKKEIENKEQQLKIQQLQKSVLQLTQTNEKAMVELDNVRDQLRLSSKESNLAYSEVHQLVGANSQLKTSHSQMQAQYEKTLAMKDKIILGLTQQQK